VSIVKRIQGWSRRRRYREGRTLSRFIAPDIRREILIVSAARLSEGIITGRARTTNVLSVAKGLVLQPEFEPARDLQIKHMWEWGGLPDEITIVDPI
jgi:hypothetical protein